MVFVLYGLVMEFTLKKECTMKRKLTCVFILIVIVGLVFSATVTAQTYKIGVVMSQYRPAFERDQTGFESAFEAAGIDAEFFVEEAGIIAEEYVADVDIDLTSAEDIVSGFLDQGVDLIHAIGIPAALAAKNVAGNVPVVFSSVGDPVSVGLVDSLERPGGNITGTITWPIFKQVELASAIAPTVGTWGIIHASVDARSNRLANLARAAIEKQGLTYMEATVENATEVSDAAKSLVDKGAEGFIVLWDFIVAREFRFIVDVCNDNDLPLFATKPYQVPLGAIASYGFKYDDVGNDAGKKAIQILTKGTTPSSIAVTPAEDLQLYISVNNAEKQGVEIPQQYVSQADTVFN
jgi:putative ABC transport system substrate-binding protein